MSDQPTVYIVDDDASIRKAVSRSLKHHGYRVTDFDSAIAFLDGTEVGTPGCLVLDISMPGMTGMELQAELANRAWPIPIIFITGHGDIPTSVRAMRQGAIDFLEKPFQPEVLRERIDQALEKDSQLRENASKIEDLRLRYEHLTPRESQVMAQLVAGAANSTNKEIARILEISNRTVDEHRSKIMQKMRARSVTELVDMARKLGLK